MRNKEFDLKRLLYNENEDLYMITYSIILILYELNNTGRNYFKDYRKLVFLIPIISDNELTQIFSDYYKGKTQANNSIRHELEKLYYNSFQNITMLRYVLLLLEKKEMVQLQSEEGKTNVVLIRDNIAELFAQNNIFGSEISNIRKVRSTVPRIRTINYITVVDNLFKLNGVLVWEE